MKPANAYKVVIVGGGPAGLAAALYLHQRAPALAEDTLIIEAKSHPRPKLCGGGVTVHGEEQLENLGIHMDVQAFTVHRMAFRLDGRTFTVGWPNAMRIFERAVFDAALADAVESRGLNLHTNEKLLDIEPLGDGVRLVTDRDTYQAKVVVAADGAKSTVRRKLRMFSTMGVARLLRVMTPVDPVQDPTWQQHEAVFDFTCVRQGVQGYMWDFPSYMGGQPYVNRGIMDSRLMPQPVSERQNLKQTFAAGLKDRAIDLDDVPLEGHPVRWFNPQAEFSRPHILLSGDAAGVDPLFAEGISYAMEYGQVVAGSIVDAFTHGDFRFADYRARVLHHRLGRLLLRRTWVARMIYRHRLPPFWTLLWRLADIAPLRVQQTIGASLALLPSG